MWVLALYKTALTLAKTGKNGNGGRRSISTGFALEILRSLHPSNHEIKDFGFVGGFSPTTWLRLQRLQFIKIILETAGVSWIIAGSQPFNGLARNGRSLRCHAPQNPPNPHYKTKALCVFSSLRAQV